jgi:HEAT repeat protein
MVEGIQRTRELLAHPEAASGVGQSSEIENAGRELIYYVRALGTIGNSACERELLTLISDPDEGIREAVAEALGTAGRKTIKSGGTPSEPLIDALLKLHLDEEPWVRMNAALALGKLGRAEGLPTLEAMLDREWLRRQKLQFPDDGMYSVTQHDPAAVPILSAVITIEALVERSANGGAKLDRTSLRAAVEKAAADPNPELQRRAKELLEKLSG